MARARARARVEVGGRVGVKVGLRVLLAWKTSKPSSCTAHDSAATRASLAPSQSEVSCAVARGAAPTALIILEAAGGAALSAGGAASAAGVAQRVQRTKACMARPSSRPTTTESAICDSEHLP